MADFSTIIQEINDDITTNGVGAITGAKLNQVLRDMIAAVNDEKQDPLTIDATPNEDSTNPVQSGGVYDALEDKADKVSGATNGNIASFDANGNIQDSGIAASDVATDSDLAGKQDVISDLVNIRIGADAGATAYQKPSTGIPKNDLASGVQTSLGKADTAVQQVTVGTTTTGNAGTNASVTNSGTSTAPVLDFTIPRGADGADGQDGADAVNPFKGWYASANTLPANPVVGDYAYVKGANARDPAAIYECTTAGTWSDSGRTADTSNIQTFASGEEVNEVGIDDEPTPDSDNLIKSGCVSEIAQELSTISDLATTGEAFVISFFLVDGYRITSGVWTPGADNSVFIISVKEGDVVTSTNIFQYAWLASYSAPVDWASVPFVPGTTNTVANTSINVVAPAGTHYMCVLNSYESEGEKVYANHQNLAINGIVFDLPINLAESPVSKRDMNILSDLTNACIGSATSESFKGYIYQSIWADIDNSSHRLIKVRGGDVVTITAGDDGSRYAFLKEYVTPSYGNTPIFATGSSNTIVSANQETEVTAPEDAKYLYLMRSYNDTDFLPSSLKINGKDVLFLHNTINEELKGLPSIIIEKTSSYSFNVGVYSEKKGVYIKHQFYHFYYEKDIPYGDNQTAHLITTDCWFPSVIWDGTTEIVQGNVNFINKVKASSGTFADEGSYVGEGHGCAVSIFTKFFLDGKEIDPLSLTSPIKGNLFRFVEKVNYYAADSNLQEDGITYPKLDNSGEMILANIHFADATYERNNKITWHNKLTVKRDHTIFEELFAGMVRVYLPYFDNVIMGDAEDTANSFSHNGSDWTFVDTGGSGVLLGSIDFLKGDNLIFYGDNYFLKQNIEQVNLPFDKTFYRITKYNDTNKSLKIYQYPAVCSSFADEYGLQPDEFMAGDVIECNLLREIDACN